MKGVHDMAKILQTNIFNLKFTSNKSNLKNVQRIILHTSKRRIKSKCADNTIYSKINANFTYDCFHFKSFFPIMPNFCPILTLSPTLTSNLNSVGASKQSTTVLPNSKPPISSPLTKGIPPNILLAFSYTAW
ncbi:EC1118_1N9_1794p [Saccharomyces cerevisiae EC1118]|uniref:Putative uncharacterized protein YNL170W n=2 Tax=Saccharomyces cerevisiae TaxID=4932 RepID=YNR0_YEAST|nr:RecName: Full=Putative uncharacterized protein YNL170W [Saccharomyces cerevisiae S288C]CAA96062.1 unnamed protein product [Saccharomyces cerevisiae]CAY82431.1 EC1118_1N9_1794p [Saccharomyces cerevisiae EC1118]